MKTAGLFHWQHTPTHTDAGSPHFALCTAVSAALPFLLTSVRGCVDARAACVWKIALRSLDFVSACAQAGLSLPEHTHTSTAVVAALSDANILALVCTRVAAAAGVRVVSFCARACPVG